MNYTLVNPSDAITLVSESRQVAACAAVLIGRGMFGLTDSNGTVVPLMIGWNEESFLAWLDETLGTESLNTFVGEHVSEVVACLRSVGIRVEDREAFDALSLSERKALNDERRTSLNDICSTAYEMADYVESEHSTNGEAT